MPRVEIPVIGPAYKSRELPLSAQVTKNMWPEINPEARNPVALHSMPGLKSFGSVTGADRGMHVMNGIQYGVHGTTFYSIDASGTSVSLGTIPGSTRCVFADDGTQLIIVNGANPYIYTVADGLIEIDEPDLTNPTSVGYLNTQFIFDNNRGIPGEFVTSEVSATFSVNALDFAVAESHPDDIVRVLVFRQNVYFFGQTTVEPWYNSGESSPPFARINGGIRPYGLAGTHAIATTSEFIYFLDEKRIPRRSGGLDYISIGNPALGVEWSKYSRIDDTIAFTFIHDHQQFFGLNFPTADRTWCYHEASDSWFQMTYGVGDERHRLSSVSRIYGINLVSDHSDGNIYEWDMNTNLDNGSAIQRQRDCATLHGGLFEAPGKQLFIESVEFIFATSDA